MESDLTRNSPPATEVQTEPKQSNFLIILLSSLLIISCLIAGFFAYQTQKLVKELTAYRLQPTATQTPTPTPDPTVNWKTYTNSKYNFEVKHPEEYEILQDKSGWPKAIVIISRRNQQAYDLPIEIWDSKTDYENKYRIENYINNLKIFPTNKGKYITLLQNNEDLTITQIISTFKFIETTESASPLPVACTMEAKICPDGSAVGRTGPKCEFSPCSTTSPQP